MYILIKKALCPTLKHDIVEMIDAKKLHTWSYVEEEERKRLIHVGDDQYQDVVLRFINTSKDGQQFLKILPSVKLGAKDQKLAKQHFGVVLGRFAELLNCHFQVIASYETVIAQD